MKKYYAYVTKEMSCYFESELIKHGAVIISCKLIKDIRYNELLYYVIEAKDGIIDPKFEIQNNKSLA